MSKHEMTQAKPIVAKAAFNSTLRRAAITPLAHGVLQRCSNGVECTTCRAKREQQEGTLQRAAVNTTSAHVVPPIVHDTLRAPGKQLDTDTLTFMESRFNHDFSGVRVHSDAKAAESAKAVQAHAYTVGQDVVFGQGQYAPATSEGRKLLAHELTHVVQQKNVQRLQNQLTLGSPNDHLEREADSAARAVSQGSQAESTATANVSVQRDLARPPRGTPASLNTLTPEEVQAAIQFNQTRFSDPYSIRVIRDVLGVEPVPAVVDEELIEAVVQWQSERRMTQDGKIGHLVTQSIFLELVAENQLRDAVFILIDSYALPSAPQLNNLRIGTGAGCCTNGTDATDAVTGGGMGSGVPVSICVCRTSIPHSAAEYDHFVRILGHELIHVPQRAASVPDNHLREFEAFFFEACGGGRAPQLDAAGRRLHARVALDHFNHIDPALIAPALTARRDQLNNLITAGGVGPC